MAESVEEFGLIEPESPARLRDLVKALARHTGAEVLRFEVGYAASTRDADRLALVMTVTHSLGPQHELAIGPLLAKSFAETLRALSADAEAAAGDEEGKEG